MDHQSHGVDEVDDSDVGVSDGCGMSVYRGNDMLPESQAIVQLEFVVRNKDDE